MVTTNRRKVVGRYATNISTHYMCIIICTSTYTNTAMAQHFEIICDKFSVRVHNMYLSIQYVIKYTICT
jgi:hypothetical protein